MKKVILPQIGAVLILVLLIAAFMYQTEPADIALDTIEERMSLNTAEYEMEKAGAMRLKRALGINAADYREVLYYTPSNTMSVEEFLMIKVWDESQLDTVQDAVEERLASQKKAFDGYGTDQTELLKNAVIYQTGPYICFFVSEDAPFWLDIVKNILKE